MKDDSKTMEESIKEPKSSGSCAGEMEEARGHKRRKGDVFPEVDELCRALIETSPDPIIMYGIKGELIAANQQAAETYGVPTVTDLIHEVKNVFNLIAESEKVAAMDSLRGILADGTPRQNEYHVKLRDGRMMTAELRSSLVHSTSGEPQAFMSIVRDITGRRRLEEELRQSEERYRTILEDIDEGYFENDLDGNLTFVNDSMCRHLGYTREELIGMNYKQYNDETIVSKVRDIFYEVYQTGKPSPKYEAVYVHKNGQKHYSEASGSLLRNAKGEPVGFRGIVRNIDDRKRAEKERENLISELQQALAKIKTLSGLLPVCASCKKIRDDQGYWKQIELYISEHSDATITHGICPDCLKKLYPELYKDILPDKKES